VILSQNVTAPVAVEGVIALMMKVTICPDVEGFKLDQRLVLVLVLVLTAALTV
jgi:hypothetical protein